MKTKAKTHSKRTKAGRPTTLVRSLKSIARSTGGPKSPAAGKGSRAPTGVCAGPRQEKETDPYSLAPFFEHVSGVLFEIVVESRGRFRFRAVNRAFLHATGLKREQIVGRLVREIIPEPSCAMVLKKYREAIRTRKTVSWEEVSVYPAGERHGEVAITPYFDHRGRATHLFGIVHDITGRKTAEMNYGRELDFNNTLLRHTSAIIVLLDLQARMIYVNEATVKMLGYPLEEIINRTPWDVGIMDAEEAARSKVRMAEVLAGRENPPRAVILRGKDGTLHPVELSSTSTRAPDGAPDRIIVTGTDLTERHHLQSEILRISEQEQTTIGHNLHDGVGQTMTGIAALMEQLESELTGGQKTRATRIRQFVQEAVQEVRRMSHGLSPLAVKNRGLAGALELLADTIRTNHRTSCACDIDPGIRLEDPEKETHLYRIAQEAANNAVRHGNAKNITISLRRMGDDACVLKVENDGTGLKSRSARAGAGIGIRVMDYRANIIGGTLNMAARPHGGVAVICRFPCKNAPLTETVQLGGDI